METITLLAPAISCSHCQRKVEGAVGALPGMEEVQVVVPTKQVTVRFDAARLSRERIESALAEAGYPVPERSSAPTPRRGRLSFQRHHADALRPLAAPTRP